MQVLQKVGVRSVLFDSYCSVSWTFPGLHHDTDHRSCGLLHDPVDPLSAPAPAEVRVRCSVERLLQETCEQPWTTRFPLSWFKMKKGKDSY